MTPGLKAAEPSPFRIWLRNLDAKISPYLFVSPFFALFALVGLFPLLYTFWVSLHDWNLIGGKGEFVGLDNYVQAVQQPNFWIGLRNTFSIFLISGVTQTLAALGLAAVLNQNIRAKTFWRMGVLLPFVVAPVAVGVIFSKMFADRSGLFNGLLGLVGIDPVAWHSGVLESHVAIATMVNFRWTGYVTLIFLAAMQAIPRELYEAGLLDGADRWQQFWRITVPMLRPTLIFVVITATIGGLQIFDEPRVFDQTGLGGSNRQWMTMTMYIYELGWGPQKSFGRAAAVSWMLFLIIIAVGAVNFLLTRRISSQEGTASAKKRSRTRSRRRGGGMSSTQVAKGIAGPGAARAMARRERRRRGGGGDPRPGWVTYVVLGGVLLLSAYPLYYSFLLGSSDAASIAKDPIPSLIPQGRFTENASRVMSADIKFWQSVWNSVLVSTLTAVSVVLFATLAGFSFSKLTFRGRRTAARVRGGDHGYPHPAERRAAVHPDVPSWLDRAAVGRHRAGPGHRLRRVLDDAVPRRVRCPTSSWRPPGSTVARCCGPSGTWCSPPLGRQPRCSASSRSSAPGRRSSGRSSCWARRTRTLPVSIQLLQASYFKDYSLILAGVTLAALPLVALFFLAGRQLVAGVMQGAVKG